MDEKYGWEVLMKCIDAQDGDKIHINNNTKYWWKEFIESIDEE
jgi:hypothetical protein